MHHSALKLTLSSIYLNWQWNFVRKLIHMSWRTQELSRHDLLWIFQSSTFVCCAACITQFVADSALNNFSAKLPFGQAFWTFWGRIVDCIDKIRQERFSPQRPKTFVQRQTVRFALTVAKRDLGFHPRCGSCFLENATQPSPNGVCWKCSGLKDDATARSGAGTGTSGCNLNLSSFCKFWFAKTNGNRCLTHLPSDGALGDRFIYVNFVGLADHELSRSPGVALTPQTKHLVGLQLHFWKLHFDIHSWCVSVLCSLSSTHNRTGWWYRCPRRYCAIVSDWSCRSCWQPLKT